MTRVLLVSTLRDEGPHLLEWIAHHRGIGVSDFLLFSNDCSDGTDRMLDALAPAGVVHLPNPAVDGKSLQWSALKAAWRHPLRKAADYILGIDSDEFVNLRAPFATLGDLIRAMGEADAITLPWRLFGHNGRADLTDEPTTRLFTRAAPPGCAYPVGCTQFKTLFRTRGPFRQIGVHRPRAKPGQGAARWLDGSGNPLPPDFVANDKRITLYGLPWAADWVQLNHYSLRSAQSFLLKSARGLPNRRGKLIDLTYWVERNFNSVEDTSVARFDARTGAELAELMALPGVADLHAAAHAHHHARFAEMMKDPANVQLFGRLLLAADSTPVDPEMVQRLVALYRAAHG